MLIFSQYNNLVKSQNSCITNSEGPNRQTNKKNRTVYIKFGKALSIRSRGNVNGRGTMDVQRMTHAD